VTAEGTLNACLAAATRTNDLRKRAKRTNEPPPQRPAYDTEHADHAASYGMILRHHKSEDCDKEKRQESATDEKEPGSKHEAGVPCLGFKLGICHTRDAA
jgi:hypothetical protein